MVQIFAKKIYVKECVEKKITKFVETEDLSALPRKMTETKLK